MGYIITDGERYIRYKREEGTPNMRGTVTITDDGKAAFTFATKDEAEREIGRLTKKARGMHVEEAAAPKRKRSRRKGFSQSKRLEIYLKTQGHCYLCGDPVGFSEFEVEHVIPLACGGSNDISNLYCSCHTCNLMKNTLPARDMIAQAEKIARN